MSTVFQMDEKYKMEGTRKRIYEPEDLEAVQAIRHLRILKPQSIPHKCHCDTSTHEYSPEYPSMRLETSHTINKHGLIIRHCSVKMCTEESLGNTSYTP
jgi:hypothetical protein